MYNHIESNLTVVKIFFSLLRFLFFFNLQNIHYFKKNFFTIWSLFAALTHIYQLSVLNSLTIPNFLYFSIIVIFSSFLHKQ